MWQNGNKIYLQKQLSQHVMPQAYFTCQPLEADDPPTSMTNVNNSVYPNDLII